MPTPEKAPPLNIGRQQYLTPQEQQKEGQRVDIEIAQMLRLNPAAVRNFIANQPPSRNIEDRTKGGFNVPEPEPAVAEGPPDPNNILAQALGYGSIDRQPVPLPRPRPMDIGRQRYEGK